MGGHPGILPLNISDNVAQNWKLWKMRFENYMIAMELDQKDQAIQCAQFLHYIGEDAFKIYTTFELLDEEKNKLDVLINKFETHFLSKENLSYERYKFFTYKQSQEETFEQFVMELKKRAVKCKLGKLQKSLTKVMIICGVRNTVMRQRLLDDDTLELDHAIQLCKVIEAEVTATESKMESSSPSYEVESKQNVQKVFQMQNVVDTNAQKPAQALLSPPQPAEVNKSYKEIKINQKGVNKEGSNMDVFNDSVVDNMGVVNDNVLDVVVDKEVNANVSTNSINNDIINPKSIPITNNVTTTSTDVDVNMETNDKKIEINEITTVPNETMKVVTTKIDLSDIVEEEPTPLNIEGYYEGDKVVISSEKRLLTENETNIKVTSEYNESEPKLIYADMQWSPSNPEGVKRYERDFLMALKDIPASLRMPNGIPDYILANDGGYKNQSKFSNKGKPKGTMPKLNGSINVGEDVKLHETENAWRPARLVKSEHATDDDRKTEELYKKVRSVLNKLTPQTFVTLLPQIKKLQIDTFDRLQGVVDLFFEKTVYGPIFPYLDVYARMCKELARIEVPTSNATGEKPELVNFRKLLINKCQDIFEKQFIDAKSIRDEKLKEIATCTDSEKKENLQFDLEMYNRQLRIKSEMNIRFIGEIFKQQMLTDTIMMRCLNNLLENKDEESLECLCKLLIVIGEELEMSRNVSLASIFSTIKNIVNEKERNVGNRIRFMLQDVIDLRNSLWNPPRREDYLPVKTIDEIQKEPIFKQTGIETNWQYINRHHLDKYVSGHLSEEVLLSKLLPWEYPAIIKHCFFEALQKSQQYRLRVAGFLAILLKGGQIQLEDYCEGLQWVQLIVTKRPITIFNQNIWDKLTEMLG